MLLLGGYIKDDMARICSMHGENEMMEKFVDGSIVLKFI
jgi:hypothetical protein